MKWPVAVTMLQGNRSQIKEKGRRPLTQYFTLNVIFRLYWLMQMALQFLNNSNFNSNFSL